MASIDALIALDRVGDSSLQPGIMAALDRLALRALSREQLLAALRAYDLCFIRMGRPQGTTLASLRSKFDALYPSTDTFLNRELCRILTYLDAPSVIPKSMALLQQATTQEDQLFYVFILRTLKDGWTIGQRKAYFSWLNHAEQNYHGGASFKNFIKHIREDAEQTLTPEERQQLQEILKGSQSMAFVKVPAPRQFVQNWQMQDLLPDLQKANHGRSFARGKGAYEAVQCGQCHKFKGEGDGSIGPDLTGVGNRYTAEYILESIILPSKVVSDQYANTQIVTKDHDVVVGRVMSEDSQKLAIRPSPLSEQTVTIPKSQIARRELSKLSPMPEGLVDTLTKDEIYDLIAYLRSAGNPEDQPFK